MTEKERLDKLIREVITLAKLVESIHNKQVSLKQEIGEILIKMLEEQNSLKTDIARIKETLKPRSVH